MPSKKIGRIDEDIRLSISNLLREVKDPRIHQGLLSVTAVETTGDLKYSKIYISVLGLENEKDFMRGLKSAEGWLRRELGHRLSLRNTPELTFILDHSIEEGAHINSILAGLSAREAERQESGGDGNKT